MLSNRLFEVGDFFAWQQANRVQCYQMLFSARSVTNHKMGLADVFMCPAVTWLDRQSPLVMFEGHIHLARLAVREAEFIVYVCTVGKAA